MTGAYAVLHCVTRERLAFSSCAPNPGPVLQSGFGRVFCDVTDGAGGLVSVADQEVVIVYVPESAFASEGVVGGFCGEGFPGFDDRGKLAAWEESDYHVNVVGHDAPGEKPVVLSLAEAQGCGHGAGDALVHECAGAYATVEVLFNAGLAIGGEVRFLLRKEVDVVLFGSLQDAMALGDFCDYGARERIGLMKGEEV